MNIEFKREERYVVFKLTDLGNSLKGDEIRQLAREYAEQRRLNGKSPLECVVVESDWPEYEPTWKAIEARMTGAQPAPNDEYIGWYCAHCERGVDASEVTYNEQHTVCGRVITDDKPPKPAPKAVAYLDLGVGGYMDIGTDLTDEALAALPKGRHMLGIVGTYGVDGYVPAQPAPSVPENWLRAIDDALVSTHVGVASLEDTYEQAKAKLDSLIGLHADIATDPAVNGGWKLVPTAESRHPGIHKMLNALHAVDNTPGASEWESYAAFLAATPEAKP